MRTEKSAWGIFGASFCAYLWTMAPSLAAYRDTGEMALSSAGLGVSHPPGYPLYILLGRLACLLPWGGEAYAVALLSAAAAAGALSALYLLCRRSFGTWPALAAAVLLGTNATFWSVAIVQEMYSLTLFFAALLLALALRLNEDYDERLWFLSAFAMGVFLGNRTDILLWAPGLVLLALPARSASWSGGRKARWLAGTCAFGLLGLSVYLYLPLRSLQGPWLDWNHPAALANFIGSLTRRGYGGTLDLLSKNYAAGEMFWPNLKVYGGHLWRNFHLLGLSAVCAGVLAEYRRAPRRLAGLSLLYLASGPLFLFLANLPPNPHAMAIVDPHYLLSDFVLACLAASGAAILTGRFPASYARRLPAVLLAAQAVALGRFAEMNRRWDLTAYDYVENVFRSSPPGAVLVAKKDVQLFALWYYQRVRGRRTDLHLLPQGLSHSAWFQQSLKRFGSPLTFSQLKTREGWEALSRENAYPVYGTMDVEYPTELLLGPASGMIVPVFPGPGKAREPTERPWNFLIRRGEYRYDRRPDFFTADLVSEYSLARQRLGAKLVEAGRFQEARRALLSSWAMKWRSPETATFLAYLAFRGGDLSRALPAYVLADRLYDRTLDLTEEYFSLEGVRENIRRAAADTAMNLGVVYEKSGDARGAERMYRKALSLDPRKAQAQYNIAVLYWRKDWGKVVEALEAALRADPKHVDAMRFLPAARQALRDASSP